MPSASCSLSCALLVGAKHSMGCALRPLEVARALPFSMALSGASLSLDCALRGLVSASRSLACSLLARATTRVGLPCRLQSAVVAGAAVSLPCSAFDPDPDEAPGITATVRNNVVELLSLELSTDEEAYLIQATMELAHVEDWLRINNGDSCELRYGEQSVLLLVGERSRSREFGSEKCVVEASSPASRLAAPYAVPLTRTWEKATAREIATELCTLGAEPVSLEWRICDWTLEDFSVESLTPMEALAEVITEAARAVSSPDGTLVVQYLYPQSPTRYAGQTPELELSDYGDITLLEQESGARPCYDQVEVLCEASGSEQSLTLTEWSGPDGDEDLRLPRSQRMIAVFVWPYETVELRTSGCESTVHPQGRLEFEHEELVEFVDGQADSSYPVEELLGWTWRCDDLGAITAQGTALSAEESTDADCSLAKVRYRSKCQLFILESHSGESVQVYAQTQEEASQGNTDLLVTVRRGKGERPSPDCIEDPLCSSKAILRERGRNYLDDQGFIKELYEAVTPLRPLVLPGVVAQVKDCSLNEKWRAKVTGWLIEAQGGDEESGPQASIRWLLERSVDA